MVPTMAGGFVKVPVFSPQVGPEGAPLLAVRQYTEVKLQLNEKRLRHASCLAAVGFVFSLITAALCLASIFVPWLKIEYLSALCVPCCSLGARALPPTTHTLTPRPPPFSFSLSLRSFTDPTDPCRKGTCYISISLYSATYCLGALGDCQRWMYLTSAYVAPESDFDISTAILTTLAAYNTGIILLFGFCALLTLLATLGAFLSCSALDSLSDAQRMGQQYSAGRVACLATSKATTALTATAFVLSLVAGSMGWGVFGAGAALLSVASSSTNATSQTIVVTSPGSYTAAGAFVAAMVAMSLLVSQKFALRQDQRWVTGVQQKTLEGISGSNTNDCCCC